MTSFVVFTLLRVTTFYLSKPNCSTIAVALFNFAGQGVQFQRSRCSVYCGIFNKTPTPYDDMADIAVYDDIVRVVEELEA